MAETFVLVHGAWHGGWCWRAVMSELERQGDRTLAPDLPGHCANPMDHAQVTLASYVDYIARFIEDRDLKDVVLAGHSLGGLTIAGVAEKIPRRLKRVVFVAAMVIIDGQSPAQELERVAPGRPGSRGIKTGPFSVMVRPEDFPKYYIQDGSPDLANFVFAALTPQPTRVLTEPNPFTGFRRLGLPTGYLVCEDDLAMGHPGVWHPEFSGRLDRPVLRSIKASHEPMFTRPIETARALSEIART
ncbi:MAG TPA: alpha/beta fold hydrolase [Candidatus Binataceae bacterium]|nr:alpha/beta fold hydrolase [Candidatus Binataceae bacterium]